MCFWPEDLLEFSRGELTSMYLALHWPIATLLEITDKTCVHHAFLVNSPTLTLTVLRSTCTLRDPV
jgi:hypothetical protein